MTWLFLALSVLAQDEKKFALTATADKTKAVLGEEIQLEVKLENTGDKDLTLPELALEKRSVNLDITIPGSADKAQKSFTYAITRGDPHVAGRLPLPQITLAKGKSAVAYFRVTTLKPGEMEITARYQDVKAAPIKVDVKPSERGSKLVAVLETAKGVLTIALSPDEAPANVMNFVALARAGFYDRMIFHRVIQGSWIQSGCPYGIGIGGPGYAIPSEAKGQKERKVLHELGTVSMCGFEKSDFNGSQFFVCLGRIEALDDKFTIIGKVADEDGTKVLKDLGRVATDKNTDRPNEDLELKKVTIDVR